MKTLFTLLLIAVFVVFSVIPSSAQRMSSSDILKAGLLGAGSGAVGGLASGGDGNDVWKGALAGMGVNIIGGALLDAITQGSGGASYGETTYVTQPQYQVQPQNYQPQAQYYPQAQYQAQSQPMSTYNEGYQAGYYNGYKEGYLQGVKDATRQ